MLRNFCAYIRSVRFESIETLPQLGYQNYQRYSDRHYRRCWSNCCVDDRDSKVIANYCLNMGILGFKPRALSVLKSSHALCPHFSIFFRILITSLGVEGAGLCASRTFVCLFCACTFLSFFSSSWCRGLAAVCDCGISWILLLTFLIMQKMM